MKKLFLFIAMSTFIGHAQYFSVTYVEVAKEDIEDFERREMDYWANVAQQNITKNKQLGWALMKKFGTAGNNNINYAFVNVHATINDHLNSGWAESLKSLGYNSQDISTDYVVYETHFYKIQDMVQGKDAKVWIWNYAKPKNLKGFLNENKQIWKPIHAKNIKSNSNSMKDWGIATKIYPSGNDETSIMTWDGFDSVEEALKTLDLSDWIAPKNSKMGEYDPDGFSLRVIWEQLKSVGFE